MEKAINLTFAILLAAITVAALYGAFFCNAPHQLRLALLTGAVSFIMFAEYKKCKNQ